MVGSIVLPIMMTAGVPRTIAATLFLMAFALGFIFNIANWTFYTKFFGVGRNICCATRSCWSAIDAIALVVVCGDLVRARRAATPRGRLRAGARRRQPRGVPAGRAAHAGAAARALLRAARRRAPAFLIAALFGVLVTRPREARADAGRGRDPRRRGRRAGRAAVHGHRHAARRDADSRSSRRARAARRRRLAAQSRSPTSPLFGFASPLVLYRGPLNPFGVGIAIFTVLLASHVLPPVVLVAAVMAVVQVQNVAIRPTPPNVGSRTSPACRSTRITKRTLPFQIGGRTSRDARGRVAVAVALRHARRSPRMPVARADVSAPAALRGFYAPRGGARTHRRRARRNGARPRGRRLRSPARSRATCGARSRPATIRTPPTARTETLRCVRCTSRPRVHVDRRRRLRRRLASRGLRRLDRREWHDHRVVAPPPAEADARALALRRRRRACAPGPQRQPGAQREPFWRRASPRRRAMPPTFFYALSKQSTARCARTFVPAVRPMRPGLRSGDVVDKRRRQILVGVRHVSDAAARLRRQAARVRHRARR